MRTLCTLAVLTALLLVTPMAGIADGDDKTITLDAKDTDVRKVIQSIAATGGLNVVVSPEVKGTVTISLKAVPAKVALVNVASSAGLLVRQQGDGGFRVEAVKVPLQVGIEVVYDRLKGRLPEVAALEAKLEALHAKLAEAHAKLAEAAVAPKSGTYRKQVEALTHAVGQTQDEILKIQGKVVDASGEVVPGARVRFVEFSELETPKTNDVETVAKTAGGVTAAAVSSLRASLADIAAQKEKASFLRDRAVRAVSGALDTDTARTSERVYVDGERPVVVGLDLRLRGEQQAKARKRYHDLKAAAEHLRAAGLQAEAKKIYEQARAAYAESRRHYTSERGEVDVLTAVNALRQDVGALRGEVKELTALVRQLLKQDR